MNHTYQEGFGSCKKTNKCNTAYNGHVKKIKDMNLSWIFWGVPIVAGIVLFFILPKEEENISLTILAVTAVCGVLYGIYKLIAHFFTRNKCKTCFKEPEPPVTVEYEEYEETQQAELIEEKLEQKYGSSSTAFQCTGDTIFDVSATPVNATTFSSNDKYLPSSIAGYNYSECIAKGLSPEFCYTTPILEDIPKSRLWSQGMCLCSIDSDYGTTHKYGTIDYTTGNCLDISGNKICDVSNLVVN